MTNPARRRRTLITATAIVASLVAALPSPAAGAAEEPLDGSVVGSEVARRLEDDGAVDVVVMLEGRPRSDDVSALRSDARSRQEAVLDDVDGSGLEAARRFTTVPAFTATVTSVEALEQLAARNDVVAVDVGLGGGGGHVARASEVIGADDLQAAGVTGAGSTVAMLDTGVDASHPDLAGSVVHEACFGHRGTGGFCPDGTDRQTGPGAAQDDAGHGTHIAGIVTSGGAVTKPGIAPDAGVVALKVLDGCSFTGCFYDFAEVIAALDHIAANPQLGVDVVNMSFGTRTLHQAGCDEASAPLMAASAAVQTLRAAGVVVIASSGNEGSRGEMTAPACLGGVISVGATAEDGTVAAFSNVGATTDLLAPGAAVTSSSLGGGSAQLSGTSMASAVVAGCVALIRQADPTSAPDAVEAAMEVTGIPVAVALPEGDVTVPRLDCRAAVELLSPVPGDTTPPTVVPVVTGPVGAAGWYVGDVEVTWTVSDGESDVTAVDGCDPVTVSADTAGDVVRCTATSAGGRATGTTVVRRDATPPALDPVLTPVAPRRHQSATADPGATDTTSGVATSGCDRVDTRRPGVHRVACRATDVAGNTATTSATYHVRVTPPVFFSALFRFLALLFWL